MKTDFNSKFAVKSKFSSRDFPTLEFPRCGRRGIRHPVIVTEPEEI